MADTREPNAAPLDEPAPCFATDAEIEVAERLRHQLEARYLHPDEAPPGVQSSEGH